jgi:hypothetical protein
MPDLAAIIEEGGRLAGKVRARECDEKDVDEAIDDRNAFYVEHGPTLLAVARAAVEMREAFEALDYSRTTGKRLLKAIAAFDAAVRGDAGGEG